MKKLHINVPMLILMIIGIALVLYGISAMPDVPPVLDALGVAHGTPEGLFTQRRGFALILIAVGFAGSCYAAMSRDGLFRKNFSQR
jgi:hypothetical protein